MILSTSTKKIPYVSLAYHGACHDFSILKTELPPQKGAWFSNHIVHVDLGYQGFDKHYESLSLLIPFKKLKGKEIPETEKRKNKKKSSIRVVVENSIGGMKRFRFLSDRLRAHNIQLYNKIAGIAVGIWNFNLTH